VLFPCNCRGHPLELSFDVTSRQYVATLCGRLRHAVELGVDALGNIAHIDNALGALPARHESCKEQLSNTRTQMDNAKEQATKTFDKEIELTEKSARLAELDALLNMDKKGSEVIDAGSDDGDPRFEASDKSRDWER
jgi:hypothetical protein